MDLRKISYFLCVAELLSYSKAAEKLHISHQALSKQIQMLEEDLGVKLFERSRSFVALTEAGRKCFQLFSPVLQSYEQAGIQMREFVRYKKDTLKISFFNALSYRKVVAPVVQFLMEKEPALHIETFSVDIGQEQRLLWEDQIDMAISVKVSEDDWARLPYRILYTDVLKIIVPKSHPWYDLKEVSEELLREAAMLVYADRPAAGEDSFMKELPVRERIPVHNMDTYMGILSQGKVFGVVNDAYSRREGKFRLIPMPEKYRKSSDVICAFKKLHPKAELMKQIAL